MMTVVHKKSLFPIMSLVIVALGCPNRQASLRLVYAPPPAPAPTSESQAEPAQAMVIEEPPPPEPAQPALVKQMDVTPPPEARAIPHKRPRVQPPLPVANNEPQAAPSPAPALEPSTDTAKAASLRLKINGLTGQIQNDLVHLRRRNLTSGDRKTLRDAQLFLDQAAQAMKAGDLERSMQLAKKAGLLVSAVQSR
jgi:hypothetical protein